MKQYMWKHDLDAGLSGFDLPSLYIGIHHGSLEFSTGNDSAPRKLNLDIHDLTRAAIEALDIAKIPHVIEKGKLHMVYP